MGNYLFLGCLFGLWLTVNKAKTTGSLYSHFYLAGLIGHIQNHMKADLKLSAPVRYMSSLVTFTWCEEINLAYQRRFCAMLSQILLHDEPRKRNVCWRPLSEPAWIQDDSYRSSQMVLHCALSRRCKPWNRLECSPQRIHINRPVMLKRTAKERRSTCRIQLAPWDRHIGHEFSTGQARPRTIIHATNNVPLQHGWRIHFTCVFHHFHSLKYLRIPRAPDEVPMLCSVFTKKNLYLEDMTCFVLHQIKFKFELVYLIYLISQSLVCRCF